MNFFKELFNNTDIHSSLIESKVLDMKDYFLKIYKTNKKITTKQVLDYLKKNNALLNALDDKPTKNTDRFDFTFKDGLEPFLFIIFLNEMPEHFCVEVIGNNEYEGFLLSSDSDSDKIKIKDNYVDSILKGKPTKLASFLKKQMMKKTNFVDY